MSKYYKGTNKGTSTSNDISRELTKAARKEIRKARKKPTIKAALKNAPYVQVVRLIKQKKDPDMIKIDVNGIERWREYDFGGRIYRIDNPVSVEFKKDSTTHRVTDADGIVHCVPAPGTGGCVLRWSGAVIA